MKTNAIGFRENGSPVFRVSFIKGELRSYEKKKIGVQNYLNYATVYGMQNFKRFFFYMFSSMVLCAAENFLNPLKIDIGSDVLFTGQRRAFKINKN